MINKVTVSKKAKKQLLKVPGYISDKLDGWIDAVETKGLETVRKVSGYHDEPLKGDRKGERSIRLSIHYRAIYVIKESKIQFVEIREVMKHAY